MSNNAEKLSSKKKENVYMGAKIVNQINTNQQSNMCLSAYSVVTQNSSTVNINLG
ncbi:hypothetical protein K8M07_03200 [Schnuerera sp. xch1]|uniref:hypothetical protein n=1 Tax=Schnuerera sp. xch1 TaxID=2874283 RepID=UPI001CBDD53F|nr:hypothetical protein [Schnuerera sp. xch1]MBZ2174248.1 hypothetical protein [Schnuerera sp. xch1]